VGDVVLATPTLAALRAHFAHARITYLLRDYVREVVAGCGWHDELMTWPAGRRGGQVSAMLTAARQLRAARFELVLLLTNSFRSALAAWLARIPRRVGYARDGRGWLLTDRLAPLRRDGQFIPNSVLPYYAAIAEHVGCPVTQRLPRLGVAPEQEEAGHALRRHYGLESRPYAVINPGAAFGAAKCWPPERFAEVSDALTRDWHLLPVLVGAPREVPLLRAIAAQAREPLVCCDDPGTTLGSLKVLVRGARLLVGNDTGPRHYGIAFGVPTVTIFGPTHPEWTETGFGDEIKLQVPVECGPCQLPRCPLDHRCMTRLSSDQVVRAAAELLTRRAAAGPPPGAGERTRPAPAAAP
jgi:heptosyltransferase-2